MSQVSKQKLSSETLALISGTFAETLVRLRGPKGRRFLRELFTPTESLMLAKRLALITMLGEGYSYYRIGKTLKMSTSTIKRIHKQCETNAFRTIKQTLRQKKEREEMWRTIDWLSRGGLPPMGAKWKGNKR